ncbi:hypothetical protein CEXT_320601 [Caerostris extrusa]|uniref:Uncharacterized protein n=1 Tax=Caerostris extrusa TaxID=172846 RepID=A0AAV4WJF2_CAEEX|nr:hypothetical protein CEXT_320601 [Caerostris extrusa]
MVRITFICQQPHLATRQLKNDNCVPLPNYTYSRYGSHFGVIIELKSGRSQIVTYVPGIFNEAPAGLEGLEVH